MTASKTKTTRNNTLMAYVTLEDDTGSLEMLVFARVLAECGPYLKENMPILAEGRISVRDEKAPQLMCDRVRPLEQAGTAAPAASEESGKAKKLYIRVPSMDDPRWKKDPADFDHVPGRGAVQGKVRGGKPVDEPHSGGGPSGPGTGAGGTAGGGKCRREVRRPTCEY